MCISSPALKADKLTGLENLLQSARGSNPLAIKILTPVKKTVHAFQDSLDIPNYWSILKDY